MPTRDQAAAGDQGSSGRRSRRRAPGWIVSRVGFLPGSVLWVRPRELNAELEHQTAKDTTESPKQPLGARGAKMADRVGAAHA